MLSVFRFFDDDILFNVGEPIGGLIHWVRTFYLDQTYGGFVQIFERTNNLTTYTTNSKPFGLHLARWWKIKLAFGEGLTFKALLWYIDTVSVSELSSPTIYFIWNYAEIHRDGL